MEGILLSILSIVSFASVYKNSELKPLKVDGVCCWDLIRWRRKKYVPVKWKNFSSICWFLSVLIEEVLIMRIINKLIIKSGEWTDKEFRKLLSFTDGYLLSMSFIFIESSVCILHNVLRWILLFGSGRIFVG